MCPNHGRKPDADLLICCPAALPRNVWPRWEAGKSRPPGTTGRRLAGRELPVCTEGFMDRPAPGKDSVWATSGSEEGWKGVGTTLKVSGETPVLALWTALATSRPPSSPPRRGHSRGLAPSSSPHTSPSSTESPEAGSSGQAGWPRPGVEKGVRGAEERGQESRDVGTVERQKKKRGTGSSRSHRFL